MANLDLVFKLAGLAMIITVIHALLKQAGRDEYASLSLLAGVTIALLWVLPAIVELLSTVRSVFQLY
ncbi:stage III sporulation protein AC [Desulfitibacter alkalitolerans]|uniref:stage III sporulation protein AC n=1 Tax=Desulfitibacter alkalitolerans TaxID=264641 RepID=UPI000486D3C6|nr:stage III sporulation protein AC [Desulfitibacter alkalitolerans]